MSSKTTYKCDVCKKKIDEGWVISFHLHGCEVTENMDLCSWNCLKKFVDKVARS